MRINLISKLKILEENHINLNGNVIHELFKFNGTFLSSRTAVKLYISRDFTMLLQFYFQIIIRKKQKDMQVRQWNRYKVNGHKQ